MMLSSEQRVQLRSHINTILKYGCLLQNPDVERYDPSGLRTAMTTNTAVMRRELEKHRADHLPIPHFVRNSLICRYLYSVFYSWGILQTKRADSVQWFKNLEDKGVPAPPGRGGTSGIGLRPWTYTRAGDW